MGLEVYRAAAFIPPEEVVATLSLKDLGVLQTLNAEDLELLNACLEIEGGLRAKEFASVERLLVLLPEGGLAAADALLEDDDYFSAAKEALSIGWVR